MSLRTSQTGMWCVVKVFHAAGRPLEDLAVVVHHAANAGAEIALTVVAGITGCPVEVVLHAQVVSNFVSQDLLDQTRSYLGSRHTRPAVSNRIYTLATFVASGTPK